MYLLKNVESRSPQMKCDLKMTKLNIKRRSRMQLINIMMQNRQHLLSEYVDMNPIIIVRAPVPKHKNRTFVRAIINERYIIM